MVFSCMLGASFYRWVEAFKDERESITDDSRSGRFVNVSNPESVRVIEDGIASDRRFT